MPATPRRPPGVYAQRLTLASFALGSRGAARLARQNITLSGL